MHNENLTLKAELQNLQAQISEQVGLQLLFFSRIHFYMQTLTHMSYLLFPQVVSVDQLQQG